MIGDDRRLTEYRSASSENDLNEQHHANDVRGYPSLPSMLQDRAKCVFFEFELLPICPELFQRRLLPLLSDMVADGRCWGSTSHPIVDRRIEYRLGLVLSQ